MNNQEAIERLKDHFRIHDDGRQTPYLDEAVYMAIKALEKQINGGWIKCSERLPKPYEDGSVECVLVTDARGLIWMAYNANDMWCFAECTNANKIIDWTEIIAWQPLPEPYKESEGT